MSGRETGPNRTLISSDTKGFVFNPSIPLGSAENVIIFQDLFLDTTEPGLVSNESLQLETVEPGVFRAVKASKERKEAVALPETAQEDHSEDEDHLDFDEHDETREPLPGGAIGDNSSATPMSSRGRPRDCPNQESKTVVQGSSVSPVRFYQCNACGESFMALSALKSHQCNGVLPKGEKKFRCGICKETFQAFYSMRLHMMKFHISQKNAVPVPSKRWKCRSTGCGQAFNSSSELKEHKQKLHQKIYTCEVCSKTFTRLTALKYHHQKHEMPQEKNHMCHICSKTFATKFRLKHHFISHQTDTPSKCHQCPKAFKTKAHLRRHLLTHLTEYNVHCDQCSARFTNTTNLGRHINSVHSNKPYFCDQCNSSFKKASSLKRHMKFHTGEKPFVCTQCEASFYRKYALVQHVSMKHKEKKMPGPPGGGNADTSRGESSAASSAVEAPGETEAAKESGKKVFRCDICGKEYSTFNFFQKHKDSHAAFPGAWDATVLSDPLQCRFCDKRLATHSSLENHIRRHTGETPFRCDKCPKAFPSNMELRTHLLSHLTELNVHCDQCLARFTCERNLKTHVKEVHCTGRPFVCSVCGATFKVNKNLSRHLQIHTGERPYQCDQCPKTFIRVSSLRSHKKTHDKAS